MKILAGSRGSTITRWAHLKSNPGMRLHVRPRRRDPTDYDIVCSLDGFDLDFRSELMSLADQVNAEMPDFTWAAPVNQFRESH